MVLGYFSSELLLPRINMTHTKLDVPSHCSLSEGNNLLDTFPIAESFAIRRIFFFFFPIAKSPGKAVGNNSRPDLHSKFSLIYFQVGATRTLRVGHFLSFLFVCLFDAHVKGRRRKRECSFKVHFKYCRSKNFSKYCLHENRMNVHKDKISHRRPIQSR